MEQIKKLFENAAHSFTEQPVEVELTRTDSRFGDFATNIALQLGKQLSRNPRELAESIIGKLGDSDEITSAEVAGPGFINITVADKLLSTISKQALARPYADLQVVIETNNPNPFKAMHIGHAFNAILADTIANLLKAGGANIHRVSYHGDVGLHVGKSMYSLLRYTSGDVSKLQAIKEQDRNAFMSQMYAEGAKAYQGDEAVKKEIDRLAEQSFVLTDPQYKAVYELCKQWSFDQIDELVGRLGNRPTEKRYLESEADKLGVETVKEHVGDVFVESDGALVFPGSKYGIFDNVFVSRSGRGLYGARDLGLMQLKDNDYHAQKSYIVTAEEQKDYFRGVIKAAELCLPSLKGVTVNISTGTVKLTTGKMSSRSGEVIEVRWLFDQIENAIRERSSEPSAQTLTGAIRYQFLKVRIGSDVVFDVNEATNLQGNTGPYLQYAHARAAAIMRKLEDTKGGELTDLQPAEHSLLLKMSERPDVFERAIHDLLPHGIAAYLYELTQEFNRFYEANQVVDDPRQAVRKTLLVDYLDILSGGLALLGIPAPEKM